MGSITATTARKGLYNLIVSVNENCAPMTITNSRDKGAALIGEDEWSAIEETLYLNSIPGMAESILEGAAEPYSECFNEGDVRRHGSVVTCCSGSHDELFR